MMHEVLERWSDATRDLSEVRSSLPVPIHVLLTEALELVRFCRDYWQPIDDGESMRPGLCQTDAPLPTQIADELLELQYALYAAHTEYLLTIPLTHGGLHHRAESVLNELVASIEWLLGDISHDEDARQLSNLRQLHAQDTTGVDALCSQLADYAAFASRLRPRLAASAQFKMSLIDDAHHLARELRQISTELDSAATTCVQLDRRNRIATLLIERMSRVRASAAVVFRNFPFVAHQAESSYELRRRSLLPPAHSHIAELAQPGRRTVGA